jgi:hypothetical protein
MRYVLLLCLGLLSSIACSSPTTPTPAAAREVSGAPPLVGAVTVAGAPAPAAAPVVRPVLSAIAPATVPTSTVTMTYTGRGFDGRAHVQLMRDGSMYQPGTVLSRSSTQLVVEEKLSAFSPGRYLALVRNANDLISNAVEFVIARVPFALSSVTPTVVHQGTVTMTLTGTGFDGGVHAQIFNGRDVFGGGKIVSRSPTQLVIEIALASLAPGTYQIRVINGSDGVPSSNGLAFQIRSGRG